MTRKPTYEELEQRVRDLEKGAAQPKQAEGPTKQQAEFLNLVIESLSHPFYVIDAFDYTIRMANSAARLGPLSKDTTCHALTHNTDRPCGSQEHPCPLELIKKTQQPVMVEHVHYDKDGNRRNVEVHAYPIFNSEGTISQMIEYCLDISERRLAEQALQLREAELEAQSHNLKEANTALKVLLKQREGDKREVEQNVLSNVKQLVSPYLERLVGSRLDTNQKALVSILRSNLNNIVSPLIGKLSSRFLGLTPTEIRVANLVKEGRTNKEMAEYLCVTRNTIIAHRYNIRSKLQLKNKKINLRSYLQSLDQ
jgi:DNA-binding CsgD family transcriptional regulator